MRKKRIPQKGFFYILKSDGMKAYKFGCSVNLKNRIRALNWKYKTKFKLLCKIQTTDMYMFECYFKWELWNKNIILSDELFSFDALKFKNIMQIVKKIFNLHFANKKIGGKYE